MWRILSMLPVERSSSTNTSSPRSRYASARCDPMNPAPPVMSTRISPHPPKNRRGDQSPGRFCPASSTMILEQSALSGERMPRSTPQVGSLPAASISERSPQHLVSFLCASQQDAEQFSENNHCPGRQLWPGGAVDSNHPAQQVSSAFRDPPAPRAPYLDPLLAHVHRHHSAALAKTCDGQ